MNRYCRHMVFVCLLSCFLIEMLQSQEKSIYDISGTSGTEAGGRSSTLAVSDPGWKIRQTFGEATVLPGCFYTFGTAQGLSGTTLDSSTTIMFGHPFARTSYAFFHIDGTWGKADDVMPGVATTLQLAPDSISLIYTSTSPNPLSVIFSIRLADAGRTFLLTTRMVNIDSVSHTLGCGFAFDPSLGNRGDGIAWIDNVELWRDTTLSAPEMQNGQLLLTERSAGRKGMKVALRFPAGTPSTGIFANWRDLLADDSPALSFSGVREIYDLMIRMHWFPEIVEPGDSIIHMLEVSQLTPDFGEGLFTRWDLPGFASLADGVVFPRELTSWVTVANLSVTATPGITVQVLPGSPLSSLIEERQTTVEGKSFGYVNFPLLVEEVYEDQVARLSLVSRGGGATLDSLVRPIFIPATPVADTGLTVIIDSIITAALPQVSLLFEAKRTSTDQKLYALALQNVWLYENGMRVVDLTLGKELGSGLGEADIVFVLDVTGSMGDEIDAVKNNILEFADSLVARGVDFRLAMVTFLDIIENVYGFTTSALQFKNSVGEQYAHGGADIPENSLDALYRASELQFRDAANKIFVWITDADFHEQDWATPRTRQEVLERLLLLDITVHAIGAPQYQTDFYKPMCEPTGGTFYDIYGNFRDILLDIGRLQGISKYRLTYQSPTAGPGIREVALTLHVAGLGGTASTFYNVPGGSGVPFLTCYPNPFNPFLRIRYSIGVHERAAVTIFDVLGREVRQLQVPTGIGQGEIVWDARNSLGQDVGTGIYFVRLMLTGPDNRTAGSTLAKVLHLK